MDNQNPIDTTGLDTDVDTVLAPLTDLAPIADDDEYVDTINYLRDYAKPLRRRVVDHFALIKRPIQAALDNVRSIEKTYLVRIDPAIEKAETRAVRYKRAQEDAKRKAEQAALAAAQAQAEAERAAQIVEAIEQGDDSEAERLIESPVVADTAVLAATLPTPVAAPKVDGVSFRGTWKAEVTDIRLFIAWCFEDIAGRAKYLEVCMVELNALARRIEGTLAIPGVRFFEKTSVATRR